MASFLPAGGAGGAGGGILYPDSADRPFNSNAARNNWANNNKEDLIKDTTVVNVDGTQWYLWTGESNPDTVSSSLWMDANQIVQGEQGIQGVSVSDASINSDGDLIITLSNNQEINTGRAKGDDGDLVYQLLPVADYGNFFDAEWAALGTNIYGVTGDGSEFSNAPFTTVSGQQYSFEVLLVNEANQYSMRITLMEAGENSGRDAILAGIDKASAEADGWRVYAFTSDPGHTDPADGFVLKQGSLISATDSKGDNVPVLGYRSADNFVVGPYDGSKLVIISAKDNAYVSRENGEIKKIILEGETVDSIVAGSNITVDNSNPSRPIISASPPVSDLGTFIINDDESSHLRTGAGINSEFDPLTGEHTFSVDPTNIDLSDYAELEKDASFAQLTAKSLNVAPDRDPISSTSSVQFRDGDGQVMLGSVIQEDGSADEDFLVYLGAIEDPKSISTKEYADEVSAYTGEGLAAQVEVTVTSTTQTQTEPVTRFVHGWANSSSVTITVDDANLSASESIVHLPENAGPGGVNYTVVFGANSLRKQVRRGETWKCKANLVGIEWIRVDKGLEVVRGMGDRDIEIIQPSLKLFQFAEGMPYHLLVETPGSMTNTRRSRLVHEFPKEKTFVFSPNALDRTYDDGIVINENNQGVATADLDLGEYSDFPIYVMEPNVVINRDQRASINYPANMTIDVSNGFYVFGTMSGWCGNNRTSGTANVYIGNNDNTRSPFGAIGLRIADDGLYIMDGTATATQAQGSYDQIKFQRDDGITNFYRFAFYVDDSGLMTYYVVSLNSGNVASGTRQCSLSNVGSNPKVYHTYDRLSNNTAAIAIAETHLVLNANSSPAEGRWNWRF